jgi:histone H3/H4
LGDGYSDSEKLAERIAQDKEQKELDDLESKEQDRFLPIANVARIMKKTLPENAKISKEAKETVQECASEFISFLTSEASDRCLQEKRKTINGEDILYAMQALGFDNYSETLKLYLLKFREVPWISSAFFFCLLSLGLVQ